MKNKILTRNTISSIIREHNENDKINNEDSSFNSDHLDL